MSIMNTKESGQVSILIVENSKTKAYLGIVYEFAIVLESKDLEKLKVDLLDAAKGYVEAVGKGELPDYLLQKSNRLPIEYKQLFEEFEQRVIQKRKSRQLSNEYEDAFQNARVNLSMACV